MARLGRCVNFGNCPLADGREPIEVAESEDFVCPGAECGRPLQDSSDKPAGRSLTKLVPAVLALALLGGGAVWLLMPAGPPPEPPPEPPVTLASSGPPPDAACRPGAATAAAAAQAREHVEQGMRYADAFKHAEAQREFEASQALAPQWPGVRNLIAAARLAQNDPAGARAAIADEQRLLECLRTLDDASLAALEPPGTPPPSGETAAARIRRRIDAVDAYTHFNLACVHAASKEVEPALAELRLAVARGFRDRQALMRDADLAPLRSEPGFEKVLASLK